MFKEITDNDWKEWKSLEKFNTELKSAHGSGISTYNSIENKCRNEAKIWKPIGNERNCFIKAAYRIFWQ